MNKPMNFSLFLRMLKNKDSQEFLTECAKSQGGFFVRFVTLERTFIQWLNLSFVWSTTNKGFDYWNDFTNRYAKLYYSLDEEEEELGIGKADDKHT